MPTPRYQQLLEASGFIDFGDQVALALRLVRDVAGGACRDPGAVPVRPRRRVPGHEPGPVGARLGRRRAASEPDGRRRRRPVDLPVPGRGDQQHPGVPRAVPRARGRSSCAATTARGRRSSRRPTGSSGSTIRIGSRSGPGSRSASIAERATDPAGRTVRLEAHPSGGDEADRIAAEIAERIAAGARPRDVAILVRANGHADPILRSLDAGRRPVAVLRHVGALRAAGGPTAPRVPARDRGPRVVASTSTRSPPASRTASAART